MIYTSYFAKRSSELAKPHVICPICLYPPKPYIPNVYKPFAPTEQIIWDYKHGGSWAEYEEAFNRDVLSKLDPKKVREDLKTISAGLDLVLLCYEKSDEHCHRRLVREWLNQNGIPCKELA